MDGLRASFEQTDCVPLLDRRLGVVKLAGIEQPAPPVAGEKADVRQQQRVAPGPHLGRPSLGGDRLPGPRQRGCDLRVAELVGRLDVDHGAAAIAALKLEEEVGNVTA